VHIIYVRNVQTVHRHAAKARVQTFAKLANSYG